MDKKLFKYGVLSAVSLSMLGTVMPTLTVLANEQSRIVSNQEISENTLNFSKKDMDVITNNGQYSYDESLVQTSLKLQQFFGYNEYGEVVINATKDDLIKELGVTEEQAMSLLEISDSGVRKDSSRGFVGVYIVLGPKVRKMNGWAAAAFAGGYVGWYAKQLAAAGPVGAGVAALVTASTGAVVKWAVENGVRAVPVGKNIPGFSLSYNLRLP
ncbi:hypothetical protein MKL29_10585 [Streptococcus suis]|nr:hypothetical protein [Streptococcus suis]HEM3657925.1 hypothetical protein [Streptococcus suis]HEM3701408.1 hypothetical protein [Streptococcus suis]